MDPIRKGVALLLAILFMLSGLLALLLFNLEHQAFAPETYQRAFANDSFYERLPGILAGALTDTVQTAQVPISMRGLGSQVWEDFIRDLLPSQTLREMGDQALASAFAYLNNESDTARLLLRPLKERMSSEAGVEAVLNLMRTQPACTLDEMTRIAMAALTQQEIALCSPPEDLYPLVKPLIQGQLQLVTAVLPDELTLARAETLPAGQADPRERLQLARMAMRSSPIVPLFLLLLVTIAAVRGLQSWFAWWGASLLITGLLGSLAGWLGAPLANILLPTLLAPRLPAFLPPALLGDGSQLIAAIVDQLLEPVLMQSLLLATVGGLMLATALLLHRLSPPAIRAS